MTRDELVNAIDSPTVEALSDVFMHRGRIGKSYGELVVDVLWPSIQRSSADSAHAKIANWLEDQARIATNGLHCGDNSTVIKHTYDWADKLEAAARHLRAEPRASADSAEPVAWAILGSNSASGIWKILQDKASADYWATQGFQVQPLGYLNRPASRAQPQTSPEPTVWLVEWPESDTVPVRWWNPAYGWMRDANKAIHFARKTDADCYLSTMRIGESLKVTEHKFVSQAHCQAESDEAGL